MVDRKEESKDVKDRVESLTTRNFYVSNCPEKVYKRFVDYAVRETGNNYAMAVKQLLDIAEGDVQQAMMYEKVIKLEEKVAMLEETLLGTKEERKGGPTTFGEKD